MATEPTEFPYTPRRGRFKGQTFETLDDYRLAVNAAEQTPATDGDQAPARPEAPRRRAGKVNREMVLAVLYPPNIAAYFYPPTQADALTDQELTALADAIVGVAAVNKYLEKMFTGLATSSAYLTLLVTLGQIALPRLARHGMIPGLGGPPIASNGHAPVQDPMGAELVGAG